METTLPLPGSAAGWPVLPPLPPVPATAATASQPAAASDMVTDQKADTKQQQQPPANWRPPLVLKEYLPSTRAPFWTVVFLREDVEDFKWTIYKMRTPQCNTPLEAVLDTLVVARNAYQLAQTYLPRRISTFGTYLTATLCPTTQKDADLHTKNFAAARKGQPYRK